MGQGNRAARRHRTWLLRAAVQRNQRAAQGWVEDGGLTVRRT